MHYIFLWLFIFVYCPICIPFALLGVLGKNAKTTAKTLIIVYGIFAIAFFCLLAIVKIIISI